MLLTDMQQTWLGIGTAGMAIGAVAIATLGLRLGHAHRHHAVASFFVCLLAASAYFAMANGQGIASLDGREVFWARYVDWVLTTPLLLLGVLTIALRPVRGGGEAGRDRTALIAGVLGLDVFMIATGVIAAFTADDTVKYVWFAVSCGAFLGVLYALVGPIAAAAKTQGPAVAGLYRRLMSVLVGLWFVYPVLWLLGTEGTASIGQTTEVATFAIIDVTAKVVFGVLLVTGVGRLVGARETEVVEAEVALAA
jgi:bacteriorhodopsin